MSYASLKQKQFTNAEYYAKIALSMFPSQLAPHLLLGEIYYEQGKIEKSKKSLLKCINKETPIQSIQTDEISKDAKKLWDKFYGE